LPDDKEKTSSKVFIMDLLQDTCKRANIVPIQRKCFNDALGIELLKKIFLEECSNLDASVYQRFGGFLVDLYFKLGLLATI